MRPCGLWLAEEWHETTSNNYYLAHTANNAHTPAPSPYARFPGKNMCLWLLLVVFPTGEGLRHPWLLSTIAIAITTWLGALSRSHGRRAHRREGCYRAGEVLRKSTLWELWGKSQPDYPKDRAPRAVPPPIAQQSAEVVGYQTTTSMEPPSVVGIPVTHHAYPRARTREIEQAARRLHARVQAATVCVVLALRAYLAYVISPLDYIGSGVHTPLAEIQSMQLAVHRGRIEPQKALSATDRTLSRWPAHQRGTCPAATHGRG